MRRRYDLSGVPRRHRRDHVRRDHLLLRDLLPAYDGGHADGGLLGVHHHGVGWVRRHVSGDASGTNGRCLLRARWRSLRWACSAHHHEQLQPVLFDGASDASQAQPRLPD